MLRLHGEGENGNGSDSDLIKEIYGLKVGEVIAIKPSEEPRYEALKKMLFLPPDISVDSHNRTGNNVNGHCMHYSVPPSTQDERYSLEVEQMDGGTIHVKRVGNKAPNGHDFGYFEWILGSNH